MYYRLYTLLINFNKNVLINTKEKYKLSLSMCSHYVGRHFKKETVHQMQEYTRKLHENAFYLMTKIV